MKTPVDFSDLTKKVLQLWFNSKKKGHLNSKAFKSLQDGGKVCDCNEPCAKKISLEERKLLQTEFWSLPNMETQLNYIKTNVLKMKGATGSYIYLYYFEIKDKNKKRCICKDFFLKTLDISDLYLRCAVFNWFSENH